MSADLLASLNVSQSLLPAARRLARVATLAAVPVVLGACDWFTDFKEQPRIEPWESYSFANAGLDSMSRDTIPMRGQPIGSVPMSGTAVPAWQVSYRPMPATLDSIAALVTNPTPMSQESLDRGRMLYQINCAVCHGDTGAGDGRATIFGMVPFPINTATTAERSDGYIWAIIRNGRGLMPNYNRIDEMDRWDVVNYVRALQGRAPGLNVETGPLAPPGETGDAVPRGTRVAPTRPAPHVKPSTWLRADVAPAQGGTPMMPGGAQPTGAAAQPADSGSNS